MLFAHNALAPGPRACFFAEEAIAKISKLWIDFAKENGSMIKFYGTEGQEKPVKGSP
jgi:hypothetical protein